MDFRHTENCQMLADSLNPLIRELQRAFILYSEARLPHR